MQKQSFFKLVLESRGDLFPFFLNTTLSILETTIFLEED